MSKTSKFKNRVIEGMSTMNLCVTGREIFNDSITSGVGPVAIEPHLEECKQCKAAVDAMIDKVIGFLSDE